MDVTVTGHRQAEVQGKSLAKDERPQGLPGEDPVSLSAATFLPWGDRCSLISLADLGASFIQNPYYR